MTSAPTIWAVVLAGGVGRRLGADRPKQLLDLGGRTVLERSVDAFAGHPAVDRVVVVGPADGLDVVRGLVGDDVLVVAGGAERRDSTRHALEAITAAGASDDDLVLVHDAARPLVPARVVDDVVAALAHHGAVATLVETPDTIVLVDPATGEVADVVPRASLRRHQTPQGFRLGVLASAHAAAGVDDEGLATDDCSLVHRHRPDVPIVSVPGDPENLKITDATDLVVARALLAARHES